MTDTAFMSALDKHFHRLGHYNSHAVPLVNDPVDQALLELHVSSSLNSMAAKRYKNAKEASVLDDINEVLANVKPGNSATLHTGAIVTALGEVKNPASRFDQKTAKMELRKRGVDAETIEAAFNLAKKENKPASSIKIAIT